MRGGALDGPRSDCGAGPSINVCRTGGTMIAGRIRRTHSRAVSNPQAHRRRRLMRNRIVLGFLVLSCAFATVTPANAVVVNGIDYTFLAKFGVLMEQSDDCPHDLGSPPVPPAGKVCMNIVGNVGVSDVANPGNLNQGRLQIGSNNDIVGTAIANRILFGTGSQTDDCQFNTGVPFPSGPGPNSQCNS